MPKQISYDAADAFRNNQKFSSSNTKVTVDGSGVKMYLFSNHIAKKDIKTGEIFISNAGWNSSTARDRLNALGAGISIKKGEMYWKNGEKFPHDKWVSLKGGQEKQSGTSGLNSIASVMMMGEIFTKDKKESNAWKLRMLKAGVPEGALHLPDDFDSLPEDEKERRLDGVIKIFKEI